MYNTDYAVMFDLECTCWKDEKFDMAKSYIIQIGACKFHKRSFEVVECFNAYVSDKSSNYYLSDFCTELTGIKQVDLDTLGNPFPAQYEFFMKWANEGKYATNTFLSWGRFDYNMLVADCRAYVISPLPKQRNFLNAKDLYLYFTGIRAGGLEKRLKADGVGHNRNMLHNAFYDAKMTVELLRKAALER